MSDPREELTAAEKKRLWEANKNVAAAWLEKVDQVRNGWDPRTRVYQALLLYPRGTTPEALAVVAGQPLAEIKERLEDFRIHKPARVLRRPDPASISKSKITSRNLWIASKYTKTKKS